MTIDRQFRNISLEKKRTDLIIRCIVTSLNIGIDLNHVVEIRRWILLDDVIYVIGGFEARIVIYSLRGKCTIIHLSYETRHNIYAVIKFMINKNQRMKLTWNIKFWIFLIDFILLIDSIQRIFKFLIQFFEKRTFDQIKIVKYLP